jgi:hypothetical protein
MKKTKSLPNEKPHHLGHRQRQRKKFAQNPACLAGYEFL